jgi:hypothetical protein
MTGSLGVLPVGLAAATTEVECNTPCYENPKESHEQMTRGCYEAKSKGEFQKQSIGFKLVKSIRISFSSGIQNFDPSLVKIYFSLQ